MHVYVLAWRTITWFEMEKTKHTGQKGLLRSIRVKCVKILTLAIKCFC